MVAETPNFLEVQSKMFNLTTEDNLAKYKNFPVGWDQRHHCITVDSFANMYLSDPDKYMVVTTSTADEEGQTCVTTTESRDYPFYTSQYHTEQILYDFSNPAIIHDSAARQFSEDVQFFFSREARNSINYYDSYIHVTYEYIWNNKHVYNAANAIADAYNLHIIDPATSLFSK